MGSRKGNKDLHVPGFTLDNPIRRLFEKPRMYCERVNRGQVVADLGCGPGYFTIPLAETVGESGRVYAVDSDIKQIQAVERKARRRKLGNIQAHHTSAAELGFIPDASVDFVLANGLLCSMARNAHAQTVSEIKRILKVGGIVHFVAGRGSTWSYVDDDEWETILAEFKVMDRNYAPYKGDYWAWVVKTE
jgi:ubiquinone/menaquinone biosynthesis C-methylase UbiE